MSTPDFFRSRLDQMIDLRHPLAVLATRLPWAAIEAAVAPKLAHQAKPAKRVAGVDLAGAFEGEFGGGISPAGRPRLSKLAVEHAPAQALVDDYAADEKAFAAQLRDFVVGQGARLTALASDAGKIKDKYL